MTKEKRLGFYVETIVPIREELFKRFPRCFAQMGNSLHHKRPLKIGIVDDIIKACPDLDEKTIRIGIRDYTFGSKYAKACQEGRARIDLDGKYAGEVSKEEADFTSYRWMNMRKGKDKNIRPSASVEEEAAKIAAKAC